jgi:methyltransferase (TIGR00027 family)
MPIILHWRAAMNQQRPSRTAIRTAVQRAAHLLLDNDPKILADPFARALAGYSSDTEMLRALDPTQLLDSPRLRTLFVLRNRYAEDELVQAVARGIEGYVILGAGLDSFAYRRPDLMASLDVFEVDHPASQAWKRARVAELGIPVPARLHHVAIDFERTTLADGFAENAVDRGRHMFISMLGVAQYLTKGALARTLRDVAATTAPGSEMVMQYVVPLATFTGDEAALVNGLAARASTSQEPWVSFYEPAEMERVLVDAGFGDIVHFGTEEALERYLRRRTDGLGLPAYFQMIKARTTTHGRGQLD